MIRFEFKFISISPTYRILFKISYNFLGIDVSKHADVDTADERKTDSKLPKETFRYPSTNYSGPTDRNEGSMMQKLFEPRRSKFRANHSLFSTFETLLFITLAITAFVVSLSGHYYGSYLSKYVLYFGNFLCGLMLLYLILALGFRSNF